MTKSKATLEKWGFFMQKSSSKFGGSPNTIGPAGLIIRKNELWT